MRSEHSQERWAILFSLLIFLPLLLLQLPLLRLTIIVVLNYASEEERRDEARTIGRERSFRSNCSLSSSPHALFFFVDA